MVELNSEGEIPLVQEQPPAWNLAEVRKKSSIRLDMERLKRAQLEEHEASLWTGITGAWQHETGTGVGFNMARDALMYDADEFFDVKEAMDMDDTEFNPQQTWEQDILKTAKSEAHYDMLKDRIRSKKEFMLNAEDLGILPTLGLQLVAEFGNIPNYFSFGLSGLARANKLRRFLVSGAVVGSANVAEEKFIDTMYNDRTATDYIVAGSMGMGLGWLGTLGHSNTLAKHIEDTGDNFGNTHMKNSVSEQFEGLKTETAGGTMRNLVKRWRAVKNEVKDAAPDVDTTAKVKEVQDLEEELKGFSTVGAQQIESIYKTFDPEFDSTMITPRMDEDNDFVQGAFASFLAGDIPQAKDLPHQSIGLTSMSQSVHSSENPLSRFMASILIEYPEGVGRWNKHTVALGADKDFQQFIATYADEFIRLKSAWSTLAEQNPQVKHSFDEAATIWTSGKGSINGSNKQMDDLIDEFDQLYVGMNEETIRRMNASGMLEAAEDLDPKHLSRGWDARTFNTIRKEHGDDVAIETLQESILSGHAFKKAHAEATKVLKEEQATANKAHETKVTKAQDDVDTLQSKWDEFENTADPKAMQTEAKLMKAQKKLDDLNAKDIEVEYKAPDIKLEAKMMAQAIYNRFLTRATVTTADSNLLSSANRGLLNDILNDVPMEPAHRRHIDAVLESMGRDQKANPMKHQIGMDLSYAHPKGLRVLDFMHTDLGSTFASKTRYWLARAQAAKQGIISEEYFQQAIEQIKRHGSDRGQPDKSIDADVARLEAAWKLIKGEPIEDMSNFGMAAMRIVRKAMATASLGKLGIVQAGETGRVMAASGITNIIDGIPFIKDMIMHMKDGRLDTPMMLDIQQFALGKIGNEHFMNHPAFRADDFGHEISKAEKQLDRGGFWLSKASGWRAVHTVQKKALMNYLGHKWYKEFTTGTMTELQMKDLGVPTHQIDDLAKSFKKHAEFDDYGVLTSLNLGKWDNDLRETVALMFHRKAANAVQDIIVGETPLWINRGIGKFLGQFRSFSIAALGKQTVHDWKMYKEGDKEAALAMQFMLATSTMAVIARIGFDAAVLPEKDRKKYLARNLTPNAITFKVLNYHGQLSPLVDMTELLASSVTPNSWGELTGTSMYRGGKGLMGRIPGISYTNRAFKGATGLAKGIMPGESMSKSDWNAFTGTLPLSSWYGYHALNKRIITPMLFD